MEEVWIVQGDGETRAFYRVREAFEDYVNRREGDPDVTVFVVTRDLNGTCKVEWL